MNATPSVLPESERPAQPVPPVPARPEPAIRWRDEWKPIALVVGIFLAFFFLPVGLPRFDGAVTEAFALTKWYAREHVILCLIPAFFIAGAISTFVSSSSVMRYLGAGANRVLAYGVASVSGTILAVCSCTVLPLFAGIYRMGAGLGPASAFVYSGPAISALAIILTARVLGLEIGVARAVGAVVFSVLIGLAMAALFRREEKARAAVVMPEAGDGRPLAQTAAWFAAMVGVLVFANWGRPVDPTGFWHAVWAVKWWLTSAFALALAAMLVRWFGMTLMSVAAVAVPTAALAYGLPEHPEVAFAAGSIGLAVIANRAGGELGEWFASSWGFAKQIMPLLLLGVLVAGFLLGRPAHEGLIPSDWVSGAVGGNSVGANLFASVAGAFMYFATLTEVPILQGLIGSGMGKGPALALLLAGPALSMPSMLVLRGILGMRKTVAFVSLVVVMATVTGLAYGWLF